MMSNRPMKIVLGVGSKVARWFALVGLCGVSTFVRVPSSGAESLAVRAADAQARHALTVSVCGLKNRDGRVLALLFSSSSGFPGEVAKAYARTRTADLSEGRATIVFGDIPVGTYAVAVLHDENANGKLDTNLLGIPEEGVGASNRAKRRLGPPRWSDAKIEVAGDTATVAEVHYF